MRTATAKPRVGAKRGERARGSATKPTVPADNDRATRRVRQIEKRKASKKTPAKKGMKKTTKKGARNQ